MTLRQLGVVCLALGIALEIRSGVSATAPAAATPVGQPCVVTTAGLAISGCVVRDGETVPNMRVRVRNIDTDKIVGETVSDSNGAFSFVVTEAGRYVVEVVDGNGGVMAVGPPLTVLNVTTVPAVFNVVLPSAKAAAFIPLVASNLPAVIVAAAGAAGITLLTVGGSGGTPTVTSPER
jgi:hypothetical protein